MAFVYILKSLKNGQYYVGSTIDLHKRLKEHNAGKNLTSRKLRPFRLLMQQEYPNLVSARKIELRIKKLKRKDYIEKMLRDGKIKMGPIAQSVRAVDS